MTSNFSPGAVEVGGWADHNSRMAPRPKNVPKELRRPTFIKAWRKHRGLTLEGLVEALEHRVGYVVSDGQLSRLERGVSPYTQDVLEAISAVLQVPVGTLLSHGPEEESDAENVLRLMTPGERRRAAAMLRLLKPDSRG